MLAVAEVLVEVVSAPQVQHSQVLSVVGVEVAPVFMLEITLLGYAELFPDPLHLEFLNTTVPLHVHRRNLHLDVLEDVVATCLNLQRLLTRRYHHFSFHAVLQQLAATALLFHLGDVLAPVDLVDLRGLLLLAFSEMLQCSQPLFLPLLLYFCLSSREQLSRLSLLLTATLLQLHSNTLNLPLFLAATSLQILNVPLH